MIVVTRRRAMRPARLDAASPQPLAARIVVGGDNTSTAMWMFCVKDILIAEVEQRTNPALPEGQQRLTGI
jgi:hypothetical protein